MTCISILSDSLSLSYLCFFTAHFHTSSLFPVSVCVNPFPHLSWVCHSANKEWHIGLVTPQQHDERPQGREGREGARERYSGHGSGFDSLLGQCQEGSVSGFVQDQLVFGVEAT